MEDPHAYYYQGSCVRHTTPDGLHAQFVVQTHSQSPVRLYGPTSPIAFLSYCCGAYPCTDLKLHAGVTAFVVVRGTLLLSDGVENEVQCTAPGALLLVAGEGVLMRRRQSADAVVAEVVVKAGCALPAATNGPTVVVLKGDAPHDPAGRQAGVARFELVPAMVYFHVWDCWGAMPRSAIPLAPHQIADASECLVVVEGEGLVVVGDSREVVNAGGQCARATDLSGPLMVIQPQGDGCTGFRVSLGRCEDAGCHTINKSEQKAQYQEGKFFKPIASISM